MPSCRPTRRSTSRSPGQPGRSSPTTNDRPLTEAERRAERLAQVLDGPVTIAGFLFLIVIVVDSSTPPDSTAAQVWTVVAWALWSLFVVEFVARMVMAQSTAAFLRRNWWQIVFLAVPFLRFLRALGRASRVLRVGTSSVRTTRSAFGEFKSRVLVLITWTATVILAGATLLYEFGGVQPMSDALHAAALASVAGQPPDGATGWGRIVVLLMVLWSAVGFAALAGSIGAFFLQQHNEPRRGTVAVEDRTPAAWRPVIDRDRP
jgi:voltage-gated potassium channel